MTYLNPPLPAGVQLSGIREWEMYMRQIGQLAEQALDLAQGRAERLWAVNQLEALIESTGHGEIVGDSTYTREGAKAARAFIEWFLAGAMQELVIDTLPDGTEIRMTPLQIMSARTPTTPQPSP